MIYETKTVLLFSVKFPYLVECNVNIILLLRISPDKYQIDVMNGRVFAESSGLPEMMMKMMLTH